MLYSPATAYCTNVETEAQRIKQLAQEVSVMGFKVQFGSRAHALYGAPECVPSLRPFPGQEEIKEGIH